MNTLRPNIGPETIRNISASGSSSEKDHLAQAVARDYQRLKQSLEQAFPDEPVRRWASGYLLARLADEDAALLAVQLIRWAEDFRPERRDRTTAIVLRYLPYEDVMQRLEVLAGSNAANELWERLSATSPEQLVTAAGRVLRESNAVARETTLHLLALDPYGPEYLSRDEQNDLLRLALDDPDPEIRGLAAEVVAADLPDLLLDRWASAPLDSGERVRMAFWRTAIVHQPKQAIESAGRLALDPKEDTDARRTALLAIGENLPTRDASPILEPLLAGDEQILAEDSANLMWRYHRAPNLANAAAASPFDFVREIAERLLHPERGSPAAGGSRPGDPTRTTDIYDQIASALDWRGPERDKE
jgi:hypothetical protein